MRNIKLNLDKNKRVGLYWTGGFDSTVLLYQLLTQGYDVSCYYIEIKNNPQKTEREKKAREKITEQFNKLGFSFTTENLAEVTLKSTGCHRVFDQMPLFVSSVLNIPNKIDTVVLAYVSHDDAIPYISDIKNAVSSLMFMRHKDIDIEFPFAKYRKFDLLNNNAVPRETLKHVTFCEGSEENCGECTTCKRWINEVEPYLDDDLKRFDSFLYKQHINNITNIALRNEGDKNEIIESLQLAVDVLNGKAEVFSAKPNLEPANEIEDKEFLSSIPDEESFVGTPKKYYALIDLDRLDDVEYKHEFLKHYGDDFFLDLPIGKHFIKYKNEVKCFGIWLKTTDEINTPFANFSSIPINLYFAVGMSKRSDKQSVKIETTNFICIDITNKESYSKYKHESDNREKELALYLPVGNYFITDGEKYFMVDIITATPNSKRHQSIKHFDDIDVYVKIISNDYSIESITSNF